VTAEGSDGTEVSAVESEQQSYARSVAGMVVGLHI
jgi:hypothetical protein